MSAEITLRHVQGAFQLDATFSMGSGVTALFGPSGSGKSTIIHAIAGLMRPDSGRVIVDGETLTDTAQGIHVPPSERRIAVVFQDARLFPHLSVRGNLLYGWKRNGGRASEAEITGIVKLLGLDALLERRPRTLSGGEKSRVALGRALLAAPRLLLLDEPLAALDAARKAEILPYLERLRDEMRVPMLYVSHSASEVARLADRMIVLENGKIRAEGSVFDVMARIDLNTGGERLLSGAVLDATIAAQDEAHGLTEIDAGGVRLVVPAVPGRSGEHVRIRIDAEDVMLALREPTDISANNVIAAQVSEIHANQNAPHADVQLAWNGTRLVARITRRSLERLGLKPGMPEQTWRFDPALFRPQKELVNPISSRLRWNR
jgi:molybdate transport system ATP-binding protein